jgi:hypothetical protein
MQPWAVQELSSSNLGDARLNKRWCRLLRVEHLSTQPYASVPQASEHWCQSKATDRFWDNPSVSSEGILAAYRSSVQARMEHSGVVLALQDTTDLTFTHQRSQD